MKKFLSHIIIPAILLVGCIPALEDPDLIIEQPKFEELSVKHFDLHLGQVQNTSKAAVNNVKSAIYNLELVKDYFQIVTEEELIILKEVLAEKSLIQSGDYWTKKINHKGDVVEVSVSVTSENGFNSWKVERSVNGEFLEPWMYGNTDNAGSVKNWSIETKSNKISAVQFKSEAGSMNADFRLMSSDNATVNYTLAEERNSMQFSQGVNNFELDLNVKTHQGQLVTRTDKKCWDSSLRNTRCS